MKPIPILVILIVTAALFLAASAPAAEFCVTNSNELKTALATAATNGEDDFVRIAAGYYPVPSNGEFVYRAMLPSTADVDFDLTIIGGWTEGLDNFPCGLLLERHPGITVLDGLEEKRVMTINIRDNTNLKVTGLTFTNGQASSGDGGGLSISVIHDLEGGYTGTILVERNLFVHNKASYGGGLYIGGLGAQPYTANLGPGAFDVPSRMGVVNNVFTGNDADRFGAALLIQDGYEGGALGVGIYAVNNTVTGNDQSAQQTITDGIFGIRGNTPNVYVINNNMWDNVLGDFQKDLYVEETVGTYRLQNNNIHNHIGKTPTIESNNISVEPEYMPCAIVCFGSELTPTIHSPLVDTGRHPCSGQFCTPPFWGMPDYDAAGKPRVAQGTVDIGAYENHDRFFADRFESSD